MAQNRIQGAAGKGAPGAPPVCWTAGQIGVDLVQAPADPFAAVGGSCGNVAMILRWLGWTVAATARRSSCPLGIWLKDQLAESGIATDALPANGRTSVWVQHFSEDANGLPAHRFLRRCPDCGQALARHQPITLKQARRFVCFSGATAPQAYYFDRISPATIWLADQARSRGALVVLDVSAGSPRKLFERAVRCTDILKYSHDQMGSVVDRIPADARLPLIVETHGAEGLRFCRRGAWSRLPAVEAPVLVDAAGSGDWVSAVLIHALVLGRSKWGRFIPAAVLCALRLGQRAAAVNCGYAGARGLMRAMALQELLAGLDGLPLVRDRGDMEKAVVPPAVCSACASAPAG